MSSSEAEAIGVILENLKEILILSFEMSFDLGLAAQIHRVRYVFGKAGTKGVSLQCLGVDVHVPELSCFFNVELF